VQSVGGGVITCSSEGESQRKKSRSGAEEASYFLSNNCSSITVGLLFIYYLLLS
jgi:hypothetical protein